MRVHIAIVTLAAAAIANYYYHDYAAVAVAIAWGGITYQLRTLEAKLDKLLENNLILSGDTETSRNEN